MSKTKKVLVFCFEIIFIFVNIFRSPVTIYASTEIDPYYEKLNEWMDTNIEKRSFKGVDGLDTYWGDISSDEFSTAFYMNISSKESDRIEGAFSIRFSNDGATEYFSAFCRVYLYENNKIIDQMDIEKEIPMSTYTKDMVFRIDSVSINGYISSEVGSEMFHRCMNLIFSVVDEKLYNNFGFGVKSLGFSSYDGYEEEICTPHIFDNDCDMVCNNCETIRSVKHLYSGDCDASCNYCGYTRPTAINHSYSNDKDVSCNICKYNRVIVSVDESKVVASGKCGKNLIWKVLENSTLVISGTGFMEDYLYDQAPWMDYVFIQNVKVLSGVKNIGNYAFYGLEFLENVYIADTVKEFGEECFRNCKSLNKINIPYGVKKIPKYAFYKCQSLKNIELPNTVTQFDYMCFSECGFENFIIPNGTRVLEEEMLSHCYNLKYVQMPSSVNTIVGTASGYDGAFFGCGKLKDIYYAGTKSQFESISGIGIDCNPEVYYATIHYQSKAPCKSCTYGLYMKSDDTYHSRSCTNCGKSEKAVHTWDSGKITKQATCAEEGIKTYTCTVCKGTKTQSIEKNNNHVYGSWSEKDINSHEHACEGCGKIESASHTWDSGKITKQPTCAREGIKTYTCTVCKGTKTVSVAKTTTHTYANGTKVNAEKHTHTCTICNKKETVSHVWDSGKIIVNPTLDSTGVREHSCTGCNATKTEEVPRLASGDLNADNSVDNKDVEYLLWHTLFPEKYELEVFADFDFSGDVNNKDVEYLLWHTLFPEKYPLYKK